MMNVDNDEKEPVTDLGLALGYSNQCIQTRSNNDSGAGVNASSRFDMTLVASGPLSELVWSPHKGLSLKCTDCSLAEKTPSLTWDVGPSNMILSPPLNIISREINDDKPLEERDLITSQAAVHVESEVSNRASLASSPGSNGGMMPVVGSSHEHHTRSSGNMEEMNTLEGASVIYINQKGENVRENEGRVLCSPNDIQMADIAETTGPDAGQRNQRTTDFLALRTNERRPDEAQGEPSSGEFDKAMITDPGGGIGDVASGSQMLGFEAALAADVHSLKQCEAFDSPVPNLTSPGRKSKELALVIDEGTKNKMKMHGSTSASPLEKLEFTAENELRLPISKDACGQSEERVLRDKSVQSEASPTNSRIRLCRRKGKEKALSYEDVNERMSKEDDDSHESVESCNGAGLFSTGKRQWSFEQQLIVGSKTVKKQIQESPASTSVVRQNSSFMNWISNMVKGLTKPNQDEAPSLDLSLSHPNYGHENHDQGIITCNKSHDPGSRNLGFQTVFQSLYCSNTKEQETSMCIGKNPIGGSKELALADETCAASITPVAFHGKNDKCKQFLLSGDGGGPSMQILSANFASTQETCKTDSAENKTSCDLACGKAKNGVSSSDSSLGKRKTISTENDNYDPPSKGKAIHNVGCRSNPLGSLWITRFSPKSLGPVLNLDHCNCITRKELEGSADCRRLIPHAQNHADFSFDQKSSEAKEYSTVDPANVTGKELQNYAPNTEASYGLKRILGHNDQKSMCKLNPLLSSQKLKSSEAMASMFARRLDALKHITPSGVKDDATCTMITCFFCGRSGHDLRNCSEITETELEGLLRNMTSYDGAEESPCFCIRCFQLGHWAISCPIPSSSGQMQSEYGASLVNHYSASKVQLTAGNENYTRMLETKESHPQVAGAHTICCGKKPRMDTDSSPNLKWSGIMTSDKRNSNLKYISSSSRDNKLEETQITPLCNSVNKQISDVPEGMFDAIRKLRLSRMDILKWMNSQISLSRLNGFFLRLRLGKWEGPGGAGYYVACITGAQREKSPQNSKNPISVDVGGIKCLVESKYVSNHDFLEDELMTWWCTTMRSGGKILSEDDLKLKFEERKRLGF
uniref:Plus3 domain-containing protein n=1 Tax=Davidia involucrata TaxID=16924 RepID=A0A5B7ARA4_DAVIN